MDVVSASRMKFYRLTVALLSCEYLPQVHGRASLFCYNRTERASELMTDLVIA